MPILPTVFFVVRNVTPTANWSQEDTQYYASEAATKVSSGWGSLLLQWQLLGVHIGKDLHR